MIKKIVALFSALVLGASLTACSGGASGSEETKTFVNTPQKGITSEITYYHVGDQVTKQTLKNTLVFAELEGLDKDIVKQQIEAAAEKYKNIPGIEHDLKITDTEIVETATIDFMNLDAEKAKGAPGILLTGDPKKVSLEQSEKALTQAGYKAK